MSYDNANQKEFWYRWTYNVPPGTVSSYQTSGVKSIKLCSEQEFDSKIAKWNSSGSNFSYVKIQENK